MRTGLAVQLSLMLLLSACGGGGDDDDLPDYSGVWDVSYHFVSDECGLVSGGIPGFVDQHIIEQAGSAAEVSAISGLIVARHAIVREDGSLLAEETLQQDIFGTGTPCTLTSRLEYEDLRGERATTLYDFDIACEDGYRCASRAIGEAARQPGPPPDVVQDGANG